MGEKSTFVKFFDLANRLYICENIIRLVISNCNLAGETSGKNIYLPYRKLVISLTRSEIVSV